jgi:arylsulfatase A-like enzyme
MAYAMDESIGKIFNKLNDKKLLDNSIIVFLSDNGGAISGLMGKWFNE